MIENRASFDRFTVGRVIDQYKDDPISGYRKLGEEFPFTVQEERNTFFRCAEYVFGQVMQEPWCPPGKPLPNEFWMDTFGFLREKGYTALGENRTPEPGMIVGYAGKSLIEELRDFSDLGLLQVEWRKKRNPPFFSHFGIYQENDIVRSSINAGLVVTHPLKLIPVRYGSLIHFFEKNLNSIV